MVHHHKLSGLEEKLWRGKEYLIFSHIVSDNESEQVVCLVRFNFDILEILTFSVMTITRPMTFITRNQCSKWFVSKNHLLLFFIDILCTMREID